MPINLQSDTAFIAPYAGKLWAWSMNTNIYSNTTDCVTWAALQVSSGQAPLGPNTVIRSTTIYTWRLSVGNTWNFSTSSDGITWTASPGTVTNLPYAANLEWTILDFNSKFYAFPYDNTTPATAATRFVYSSTDGITWTAVSASPWGKAINLPGFIVSGSTVYCMGGYGTGGELNTIYSSSDGITWSLVSFQAVWPARYSPWLFSWQGNIYCAGGIGASGLPSADLWKFVPGTSQVSL